MLKMRYSHIFPKCYDEICIFTLFSWRDWTATIIPCLLQAPGALASVSLYTAICGYFTVLLWATLYIYDFNLFTQLLSIEEDSINKPDRPLPARKVSVEGTWKRCIIVWLSFLSIPLFKRQVIWNTIFHVFFTILLATTRVGGYWLVKSTIMIGAGTFAMLDATWTLMSAHTSNSLWHIISISIWAGLATQAQDFRDQEGDKVAGRQTLPLVFGDANARYLQAGILIPVSFAAIYAMGIGNLSPMLLGLVHGFIALRTLAFRTKKADHTTFMVR